MRIVACRVGFLALAALLLSTSLPAQTASPREPQTSGTFRWINFHSPQDQNIVVWVTRSLQVANWTAIREIGVEYDAALVVTSERANSQAAPGSETFTVWSVSLTSHVVAPLVTGVNLRWFDQVRFSDGAAEEWPVLYDNCRECAPNTYFTALYYDLRGHSWSARWMTGGHGVPVWNTNHAGVDWTQVYAVMSSGEGHVAMYTWNHFEHPKPKPPDDFLFRYDLDPLTHLDRSAAIGPKEADPVKLQLCRGADAVQGLARGQDSALCEAMLKQRGTRQPVTTPPANNHGQASPPRSKH
jgi:hypothetical protein